jgi:hypothetical protein
MSAAADSKSAVAVNAGKVPARALEQKEWTDAIGAAVGSALLPELIRLAAEYLTAGLRFDPQRMSKFLRLVQTDTGADGWGRRRELPGP